ncbi:MAG: hypothetical protein KA354_13825 [Phycisphaerae bacterium]|nr:hypothetical protein [Phycisphaerae bacterium]
MSNLSPVCLSLANGAFSSDGLIPLGIALLAMFLLMNSMRRRQRDAAKRFDRPVPLRPPPLTRAEEVELRRNIESLLAELQELSRRISADIDTRYAKLEAVIRDADRRIAVLNRLTRQRGEVPSQHPTEDMGLDVRYDVVYELSDAGFSAIEIAKDLGKTTGEIELILKLRPKPGNKTAGKDEKKNLKAESKEG